MRRKEWGMANTEARSDFRSSRVRFGTIAIVAAALIAAIALGHSGDALAADRLLTKSGEVAAKRGGTNFVKRLFPAGRIGTISRKALKVYGDLRDQGYTKESAIDLIAKGIIQTECELLKEMGHDVKTVSADIEAWLNDLLNMSSDCTIEQIRKMRKQGISWSEIDRKCKDLNARMQDEDVSVDSDNSTLRRNDQEQEFSKIELSKCRQVALEAQLEFINLRTELMVMLMGHEPRNKLERAWFERNIAPGFHVTEMIMERLGHLGEVLDRKMCPMIDFESLEDCQMANILVKNANSQFLKLIQRIDRYNRNSGN